MFTAKGFLRNRNYETLDERILSDPERLRLEFLEIATDARESYLNRITSLRILWSHAHALGSIDSLSVTHGLIAAIEREFPPQTLEDIARTERDGRGHRYSMLLYGFCIALANVAGDSAHRHIDVVRQVFKGTWREPRLESRLETIKRNREGRK
jgi:hypothetical protein